jgi:hypothetical protein
VAQRRGRETHHIKSLACFISVSATVSSPMGPMGHGEDSGGSGRLFDGWLDGGAVGPLRWEGKPRSSRHGGDAGARRLRGERCGSNRVQRDNDKLTQGEREGLEAQWALFLSVGQGWPVES